MFLRVNLLLLNKSIYYMLQITGGTQHTLEVDASLIKNVLSGSVSQGERLSDSSGLVYYTSLIAFYYLYSYFLEDEKMPLKI